MTPSRSPGPPSPSSITAATAAAAAVAAANNSNINPALANAGGDAASQLNNLQLGHMDSAQILALLRHLPGVFNKLTDGSLKEGAASQLQQHLAGAADNGSGGPMMNDPNDNLYPDDPNDADYTLEHPDAGGSPTQSRRKRPDTGSEEWIRMRKANHKEVERRRRGNINEGINALAAIMPNDAGESKAKGAILSRATQYIQHLKDNEARNIEKWTLEKLLMDQAMGDLQAQLEELRKMWDDEHNAKLTLENEVHQLQSQLQAIQSGAIEEGSRKRTRME